jgi:hypothetical protein
MAKKSVPKSKAAKGKVKKVMHEFKEGTLKSSSGKKVTDEKQAMAIALSEAREAEEKFRGAQDGLVVDSRPIADLPRATVLLEEAFFGTDKQAESPPDSS